MKHAIFLRGINTGGMHLAMQDFKAILQDAGCLEPATIQAAGTAVFTWDPGQGAVPRIEIERRLSELIGKPVSAIIRTQAEIEAIIRHVSAIRSSAAFHDYVMLTDDPGLFGDLQSLHEKIRDLPGERLINGKGYFIWTVPKGQTLGEFGSKVLGSATYKRKLTSRNISTIIKIRSVMDQQG
jgi:uncharacterized protein (DUF1697 family)